MWANLLLGLVLSFVSYLLQPKPSRPDPADEVGGAPKASEGDQIPYVRGTAWTEAAQVAWWGDMDHEDVYGSSSKK